MHHLGALLLSRKDEPIFGVQRENRVVGESKGALVPKEGVAYLGETEDERRSL